MSPSLCFPTLPAQLLFSVKARTGAFEIKIKHSDLPACLDSTPNSPEIELFRGTETLPTRRVCSQRKDGQSLVQMAKD